jgi:hypothetical protein
LYYFFAFSPINARINRACLTAGRVYQLTYGSPLDRDNVSLCCETVLYSEGELAHLLGKKYAKERI